MPKRWLEPRLWRVRGYRAPDPGTKAFALSAPFSGRRYRQRLFDRHARQWRCLEGRLLRAQCTHHGRRGERCRRTTTHDYTLCTQHLLRDRNLVVAPSRIAGAGLGLYVADPHELRVLGRDRHGRPLRGAKVVVEKGARVGGDRCMFLGELITDSELHQRYPWPNGGDYVMALEGEYAADEGCARTALSYSNDAVDLRSVELRRNHYDSRGQPRYNLAAAPHVCNARPVDAELEGMSSAGLEAVAPLRHGDEVYWSYADTVQPVRTAEGRWKRDRGGDCVDMYWSADNRCDLVPPSSDVPAQHEQQTTIITAPPPQEPATAPERKTRKPPEPEPHHRPASR